MEDFHFVAAEHSARVLVGGFLSEGVHRRASISTYGEWGLERHPPLALTYDYARVRRKKGVPARAIVVLTLQARYVPQRLGPDARICSRLDRRTACPRIPPARWRLAGAGTSREH